MKKNNYYVSEYSKLNSEEYFAEAFAFYIQGVNINKELIIFFNELKNNNHEK